MGVSGCGKTHVGRLLAERLGWDFLDGDDFHPEPNVRKMASGIPLDDDDRWPWLGAIRDAVDGRIRNDEPAVVACSALKASYRQALGLPRKGVALVYLTGDPELIRARLEARPGHFMPPSLLASQLATLEPPAEATTVDVTPAPEDVACEIARAVFRTRPG